MVDRETAMRKIAMEAIKPCGHVLWCYSEIVKKQNVCYCAQREAQSENRGSNARSRKIDNFADNCARHHSAAQPCGSSTAWPVSSRKSCSRVWVSLARWVRSSDTVPRNRRVPP